MNYTGSVGWGDVKMGTEDLFRELAEAFQEVSLIQLRQQLSIFVIKVFLVCAVVGIFISVPVASFLRSHRRIAKALEDLTKR